MTSFFGAGGKKKGNFSVVASVDEHSLVFVLLHNQGEEFQIERHGVRESYSYPGTFLLDELLRELRETFTIKELVVSFAPPYFEIQASNASISRATNRAAEITKGERRQLESKMVEQVERQLRKRLFEDSGILPDDFVIQRADVFRWKIDGYAVEQPQGFKGERIEGLVLGTFLRQDYSHFVKKLQKKHGLGKISVIHPFEGVQKLGKNGVLVYLTEKKTQVLVVKKELFHLTESFSPGGNTFRDTFQEEFGMVENIAGELEEKYLRGHLSEDVREKLHQLLLPQAFHFGKLIKGTLGNVYFAIPPEVFVFGNGVQFPELRELFAQEEGVTPFSEQPNVEVLLPKDIQERSRLPKDLNASSYAPALFMIESRYAKETH